MRRWEWLFLLCGAVLSAAVGTLAPLAERTSGFFWGLGASLLFGAVVAWLYARER